MASADTLYLPLFFTRTPLATPVLSAALTKRLVLSVTFSAFLSAGRDKPVRSFDAMIAFLTFSVVPHDERCVQRVERARAKRGENGGEGR